MIYYNSVLNLKKILRISLLICWYCIIHVSILQAQVIDFKHYSIKDGLSQIEIKCIFQDSEGYMWIGTQNGLNKFDGYYFDNIFHDPTDTTSLSSNWIFDITEDSEGNLWFATKEGLNKYDKKERVFYKIKYKNEHSPVTDDYVYAIASDEENIYINTPPSLSIYNYRTGKLKVYNSKFSYDGILHDLNFPILVSQSGIVWVGSDKGLFSFDPKTEKFEYFQEDISEGNTISNSNITALAEDKHGNILIGTQIGLNIYDPLTKTTRQFFHSEDNGNSLTNNFIRSIICDHWGSYWIGTEDGGLNKIEIDEYTGNLKFTHYKSGAKGTDFISHDIVYSLLEDKSCNLWIGTLAGLSKIDLKTKEFNIYKKTENTGSVDLLDNFIASIYKDTENKLWIGNWGKGLNVLDREKNEVEYYSTALQGKRNIPNNFVHVLFEDSAKRFWLGTRNGISIYSNEQNKFIPFHDYFSLKESEYFVNNRVYCINELSDGRIWIGTGNGIFIFDPVTRKDKILRKENGEDESISHNLVYSILEDSDKDIWIATSDGLDKYIRKTGEIFHYRHIADSLNTLCNDFTISLCEDKYGNIWIGTNSGVNRFNKKDSVFTYYSVKDGLSSNIVYDIIEDKNSDLWFSTGRGLVRYDIESEEFKIYSFEEELQGAEFNLKAVYRAEDGEMFFGSVGGIVSFYPDSLRDDDFNPPVVITSFTKEREGVRTVLNVYHEEVVLSYRDYAFTIKFAALDYTNPNKNRYAYKMKGISDEWVDLRNRRFVHFTTLNPGRYVFSVKGTNHDGVWNEKPTVLKIRILPPWWRNNYAYTIYIILIIISIVVIIKWREKSLVNEKNKLDRKIKERTAEIDKQREKLNELNNTKDKFFSILAHDLKNPFSSLFSMSEVVYSNYEDLDEEDKQMALKKIHKSAKLIYNLLENLLTWSNSQRGRVEYNPVEFNLPKLVDQNMNLHRSHAEKKGIRLVNKIDGDLMVYADMQMINTVLRNLINNAIKFTSKDGSIEVLIEESNNNYVIEVKDEGVGISEENIAKLFHIDQKFKNTGTDGEKGTGLGLILCKEFVEKCGGNIWCESSEGEGTSFYFTIPYK